MLVPDARAACILPDGRVAAGKEGVGIYLRSLCSAHEVRWPEPGPVLRITWLRCVRLWVGPSTGVSSYVAPRGKVLYPQVEGRVSRHVCERLSIMCLDKPRCISYYLGELPSCSVSTCSEVWPVVGGHTRLLRVVATGISTYVAVYGKSVDVDVEGVRWGYIFILLWVARCRVLRETC